jgi:methionine synthase II (cobalamin-independent)
MQPIPIRTTVVGSYPFPGWLEFAAQNLPSFGAADIEEMAEDAVITAIHDQMKAGLDVITDGEQTRFDFNLSLEEVEDNKLILSDWSGNLEEKNKIEKDRRYRDATST